MRNLADEQLLGHAARSVLAGSVVSGLVQRLSGIMDERNLGLVVPSAGCVLSSNPRAVRIADVAVITWNDLPTGGVADEFLEGGPTLAVKVISAHDLAEDVHGCILDFFDAGSRQVWVLWPHTRSASVRFPDGKGRELGPESTLDGGDVLPGFSVPVGDLFDVGRQP